MAKSKKEKAITLICYVLMRIIAGLILALSVYKIIVEKIDELESRYFVIAFNSLLLLGVSFLPSIIEHRWKIDIPEFMELLFIMFCIGSLLIGEIIGIYQRNSWWDGIMHMLSGSLIAIFTFSLLRMIIENNNLKFSPLFTVFLVFCITSTVGVMWEIIEYLADTFTGSNMQRYFNDYTQEPFIGQAALKDTMLDFILNSIGAFIVCVIGFIDLKITKITLIKQVKKLNK